MLAKIRSEAGKRRQRTVVHSGGQRLAWVKSSVAGASRVKQESVSCISLSAVMAICREKQVEVEVDRPGEIRRSKEFQMPHMHTSS